MFYCPNSPRMLSTLPSDFGFSMVGWLETCSHLKPSLLTLHVRRIRW
ncbi:hypothetical protein LINGRAHAP2_LOCUS10223 [Linum grandiflorum]